MALKYAITLDGKIATKSGKSKWITGEKSREFVHHLRNRYAGIMCGVGTVLADNPLLNCRIPDGTNPVRIICDSKLRIPLDSQIIKTAKEIPTIIACTSADSKKEQQLIESGAEILKIQSDENGRINLKKLIEQLGERKIDSILIEGGGELNYSRSTGRSRPSIPTRT